jgi:replicative DNA helicase
MTIESPTPQSPVEKGHALPHNIEAEMNCLGSCLRDPRLIPSVAQKVRAEDFYRNSHQKIFEAVVKLDMAGKSADLSLLSQQLKENGTLEEAGGDEYLCKVMENVPIPLNAAHYAGIVLDCAMRRAAVRELMRVGQTASDMSIPVADVLAVAERGIGQCRERLSAGERLDIMALSKQVIEQIESAKYPEKRGLVTGFADLDKLTGGIKQQFIVIAGRPSMGKSQFSFNVARKAVEANRRVLIVTLEMSAVDVLYSIVMAHAHVNSNRVRDGFANEEEIMRVTMAMSWLIESNKLWIEEPKQNDLYAMKALVREHRQSHHIDLAIIDYLQLLECGGSSGKQRRYENRQQEVTTISRTIKMMSRELEIPIVGICQLHRGPEGRDDHRPRLSDLRESGSLEQDADIVMLLYRDDYYNRNSASPNICEIDVAKNRGGRTGVVETVFLRDMLRFEDCAKREQAEPPVDNRVPD